MGAKMQLPQAVPAPASDATFVLCQVKHAVGDPADPPQAATKAPTSPGAQTPWWPTAAT
jgi:hypothetical protein